ncbi:MAG: hypothetical protein HZB52_13480, partial [Chloroflexi bacterium]|nr:hypothetical protein [Chloroflexota bacterium]
MFRRHILLTLLALSSLTVAATLPFVNTANTNHTTGFGLRLNLMINNDATPLLNAAQIMRVDWLAQDVKW